MLTPSRRRTRPSPTSMGCPCPLDEVWSWVGDTPVDVTVIRDEKDCAAQAAKREAQLELEKRLEEVGALFGVDDRHAHRGRGGPPPPERPWFARSGPSAAAASELEYARVARLPRDLAADARRAKEEAARPTREDLRMLRLERTRRAKTLQETLRQARDTRAPAAPLLTFTTQLHYARSAPAAGPSSGPGGPPSRGPGRLRRSRSRRRR